MVVYLTMATSLLQVHCRLSGATDVTAALDQSRYSISWLFLWGAVKADQTGLMRISIWLQPYPSYCLLRPSLAIWNRCGRKKRHPVTHLPITCLWLQYKKWYALKAMIFAPGFSVPVFPVWDSMYMCTHKCMCVYDMFCWSSFVQSSPAGENGPSESENTIFSGKGFFSPLFSGRFRSGFYRLFHLSDLCPLSRLLHGPRLQQPHGRPTRLNEVSYQ